MTTKHMLIAKRGPNPVRGFRRGLRRGVRPESVLWRGGTLGDVARALDWIARSSNGAAKRARFSAVWGAGEGWTALRIAMVETARRAVERPESIGKGMHYRYCKRMASSLHQQR